MTEESQEATETIGPVPAWNRSRQEFWQGEQVRKLRNQSRKYDENAAVLGPKFAAFKASKSEADLNAILMWVDAETRKRAEPVFKEVFPGSLEPGAKFMGQHDRDFLMHDVLAADLQAVGDILRKNGFKNFKRLLKYMATQRRTYKPRAENAKTKIWDSEEQQFPESMADPDGEAQYQKDLIANFNITEKRHGQSPQLDCLRWSAEANERLSDLSPRDQEFVFLYRLHNGDHEALALMLDWEPDSVRHKRDVIAKQLKECRKIRMN